MYSYNMVSLTVVGVITAFVVIVAMYIDSKLFDEPKSKLTYIKNIILCIGVATGAVQLFGSASADISGSIAGSKSLISGINEEILTGVPDF